MKTDPAQSQAPARVEYLKVQNFRALHEVEFKDLTPLTVLLGPNGSGKSTVFDVFAFLSECFELGLAIYLMNYCCPGFSFCFHRAASDLKHLVDDVGFVESAKVLETLSYSVPCAGTGYDELHLGE